MTWRPHSGYSQILIAWQPPRAGSVEVGGRWMRTRLPGRWQVRACDCPKDAVPVPKKRVPIWAK